MAVAAIIAGSHPAPERDGLECQKIAKAKTRRMATVPLMRTAPVR